MSLCRTPRQCVSGDAGGTAVKIYVESGIKSLNIAPLDNSDNVEMRGSTHLHSMELQSKSMLRAHGLESLTLLYPGGPSAPPPPPCAFSFVSLK